MVHRTESLALSTAFAGIWVGSEMLKGSLAPGACRVCGVNGFDAATRDALRWPAAGAAATSSDVLGFGIAPLLAVGALASTSANTAEFVDDLLIVGEATFGTGVLVQSTKFLVGRERPFVRELRQHGPQAPGPPGSDDNLSFFSGHTSVTVALGTSVATLATLRGHRAAPWLWASGIAAGLATGYLRIAADKHYATDVLTGAVVGAAMGITVPLLHVARESDHSKPSLLPTVAAGPSAVSLRWRL